MSKLFSDPEYKRMSTDEESWLELAIEPFRFYLNEVIPLLPEKIELDYDQILKLIKNATSDQYLSISAHSILQPIADKLLKKPLSAKALNHLVELYSISMDGDEIIDFANKTLTNSIVFSKDLYEFPEDKIKGIISSLVIDHISIIDYTTDSPKHGSTVSRINEVMDIVGFEEPSDRTTRSMRKKQRALKRRIRTLIAEDEWRIRSYDVIEDLCININEFIKNGNMHALMNITRLKCMTHKGAPIYSMEDME